MCIQERLPDVADAVEPLIQRLRTERLALCHGDFSPKNLLVHAGGFTLVDYETGHFGDPAMDLGFFLSHLLLKAIQHWAQREEYFQLTRAFWQGYEHAAPRLLNPELRTAGIGHLGVCLLARIDGTSPAPYLTDEAKRDMARRLGRRLLDERPGEWDEVLRIAGTLR